MTLKRPFAQINFLTDDIADAGKNGLTIDENTHSSITLSKVATTLNPFTNTVGGFTEAEVIFGEAAIPALSETVTMGSAPDAKRITTWVRPISWCPPRERTRMPEKIKPC